MSRPICAIAAAVGLFTSAAIFSPAVSAQGDAPEMLQPASAWNLNYADRSCRLARIFGEGDDQVALAIDTFGPGGGYQITVAGREMRRVSGRGSRVEVETRFGPYEEAIETSAFIGDFGRYEPALIIGSTSLGPQPDRVGEEERAWDDPAGYEVDPAYEEKLAAREARAEWLSISRGRRAVYLATGPMGEPLAAMRQCSDSLLEDWGVDVAAHRTLTRYAMPTSDPAGWIISDDYPMSLIMMGAQGAVRFRLTVDADGKPERCHIQGSTRPEGFETAACKALMRRAQFAPARDAQGQPIRSYYVGSIRFQIAGS